MGKLRSMEPCLFPYGSQGFQGEDIYPKRGHTHIVFLSQLILNPEPKLTLIETKNFPRPFYFHRITSSGDNIEVTGFHQREEYVILELDFGEMKWVTMGGYALFVSDENSSVTIKRESWADPWSQYWRHADGL